MTQVTEELLIYAPKSRVGKAVFRSEEFPNFLDDVKEVTILQRDGSRQVSKWRVEIEGIELQWTEEDWLLLNDSGQEGSMHYRLLEGDFDRFEGAWHFSNTEDATRVRLSIDYDLGLPNFEDMMGFLLRLKVEQNARDLLRALKERTEEKGETVAA